MNPDKILIIEDDPTMLWVLKDNFEFSGYEVHTASDGKKGIQAVFDSKPNLIILDIPFLSRAGKCRMAITDH
jgi:DNA-binding response OmpR family regulator